MVPVGEGHGLFWMLLSGSGMLIFSGGRTFFFGGLAGGGGGLLDWLASSSTNDWKLILIFVLGKRNTHLQANGNEYYNNYNYGGIDIFKCILFQRVF